MSSDTNPTLLEFSANVFSQNGEDGIIDKIFELIGVESRRCIEFGAWDGFHLSNTANLWTRGWSGILIEARKERYELLVKNTQSYDCRCVQALVSRTGPNSLDSIVSRTGMTTDVDLLSVDIDGDDYYILDSLTTLRPRVIVCEYNPTIPAEADVYGEPGAGLGASVTALARVADEKGYTLVAITDTNCFFVLSSLMGPFRNFETRLQRIKCDRHLLNLYTDYSGDYVLYGHPPYGLALPCLSKINGPHARVTFKGPLTGATLRLYRWMRSKVPGDAPWLAPVRLLRNRLRQPF